MNRRWDTGLDHERWRQYRLYRGMMTIAVAVFVAGIMIASYTYLVWMGCVIAFIGMVGVFLSVIIMCKHQSRHRAAISVTVNTQSTSIATTQSMAVRQATSHHRSHSMTSVTASRTELWELRTRLEQERSWMDQGRGDTVHPPVDNGWMADRSTRGGQPQYGGFTQPAGPPPDPRAQPIPANGGFTNPGPGPGPSTSFSEAPPSYEEAIRLPTEK